MHEAICESLCQSGLFHVKNQFHTSHISWHCLSQGKLQYSTHKMKPNLFAHAVPTAAIRNAKLDIVGQIEIINWDV